MSSTTCGAGPDMDGRTVLLMYVVDAQLASR